MSDANQSYGHIWSLVNPALIVGLGSTIKVAAVVQYAGSCWSHVFGLLAVLVGVIVRAGLRSRQEISMSQHYLVLLLQLML